MDISGGDGMSFEEYQNQLFEAIESQNEEAFSSLLNDENFRQNNSNLSTPKVLTGLTLMQVAAKQENAFFVNIIRYYFSCFNTFFSFCVYCI